MNTEQYIKKEPNYFTHTRLDIISVLPVDPEQKILEIGAGAGDTLVYIKENHLASEVMGVEHVTIPGSNQQYQGIDKFQIANIENEEIDAPKNYFDVIICADVLEHLSDPWKAINKITGHLKPGGLIVASIPNIREWKALGKIFFKGTFSYEDAGGIMDKTHLRFFCKRDMLQLLNTDQLSPVFCKPNFLMKSVPKGKKRRIINMLSLGLFKDFLAVQYIIIAKKRI